jgi:hypothetical protein
MLDCRVFQRSVRTSVFYLGSHFSVQFLLGCTYSLWRQVLKVRSSRAQDSILFLEPLGSGLAESGCKLSS